MPKFHFADLPARHYFITGTDTGIGKTVVTCALLDHFGQRGYRTVGMKPVAAGLIQHEGDWVSEDVVAHAAVATVAAPLRWRQPVALHAPIAPHLAAAQEAKVITLAPIVESARSLEGLADCVIAEGAGGICVPLDDKADLRDLAVALGYPVIMVVGMRLGCINHARLTLAALLAQSVPVAGWVANAIDPNMPAYAGNFATLQACLSVPCIGWSMRDEAEVAAEVAAAVAAAAEHNHNATPTR
jgi:dethiobiotin synthetase